MMTEFLLGASAFVLVTVALGLIRVLRGPAVADRMLAAQLLGTGGVASLLLAGVAMREATAADLALLLALLAAFASVAFVIGAPGSSPAAEADPRQPLEGDGAEPVDPS